VSVLSFPHVIGFFMASIFTRRGISIALEQLHFHAKEDGEISRDFFWLHKENAQVIFYGGKTGSHMRDHF